MAENITRNKIEVGNFTRIIVGLSRNSTINLFQFLNTIQIGVKNGS